MSTDDNAFRRVDWPGVDGWVPSDDDDEQGLPLRARGPGLSDVDLELLTLAARALGAVRVEVVDGEQWVNLHFADASTLWNWNPLLHGDDAINLAVDLGLQVFPVARTMSGEACSAVANTCGQRLAEVTGASDIRAATRLAITRGAAAEIDVAKENKQA